MDILNRVLSTIQQELGADIFTDERREYYERQFRFEYGAEAHYVASLRAFEVQKRHAEVRRLIGQGLGNSEIAERLGITRQQVWNIRQFPSNPAP